MEEKLQPDQIDQVEVETAPAMQPQKKSTASLVAILLIAILIIAGGIYAIKFLKELKACTQEAKFCPDGSYVGRTGPNCEFAPCPNVPSESAEPAQTPDETGSWRTYTNGNPYLFQMKYPPHWVEKTNVSSGWPYFESPEGEIISFNAGPKGGMSGNDTLANYCQTRDKAGTILEKYGINIC